MEPTIMSGSLVATLRFDKYNINDIIVLQINDYHHIAKRIAGQINTKYKINSDNKNTSSSLCDYTYTNEAIIGKVIFKFNPTWKFSRFVKCFKKLLKYDTKYADEDNQIKGE